VTDRPPPRIALVHAVTVAMPPVIAAFAALWPQARLQHLLDDALSPDREADGELTAAMRARIAALAGYARASGADGILFTCSAFGPAIDDVKAATPLPVLKPNEAMFAEALDRGRRIGMLATFAPSVPSMEEEFEAIARARGVDASLRSHCVPEAMQALRAGRGDEHDRRLAEAASQFSDCDALLLAHFSTSRAQAAVGAAVRVPVLTSPGSAVIAMRAALAGTPPGDPEPGR
jgi:Asp/Glu/hydantoin racemase